MERFHRDLVAVRVGDHGTIRQRSMTIRINSLDERNGWVLGQN